MEGEKQLKTRSAVVLGTVAATGEIICPKGCVSCSKEEKWHAIWTLVTAMAGSITARKSVGVRRETDLLQ